MFSLQDNADGMLLCLSSVTERCGFESGRNIEQALGVVDLREGFVTAVDGTAVVGRAQADGVAADVLVVVALVPENPGPGQYRAAMAAQQRGYCASFCEKGIEMLMLCHKKSS